MCQCITRIEILGMIRKALSLGVILLFVGLILNPYIFANSKPVLLKDEIIKPINEEIESKTSMNKINELKELYNKCIYLKSQSYCNCLTNDNERLCAILILIFTIIYAPIVIMIEFLPEALGSLLFIITSPLYIIALGIMELYTYYGCWEYLTP